MTLLETIVKATTDSGDPTPPHFPIILNADEVFPNLKPENEDSNEISLVRRLSGWRIPESDAETVKSVQSFINQLKRKLKKPKSLDRDEFLGLIMNSFPIEKLSSVIGEDMVSLVAEGCIFLELWEPLETLILQGLIGRLRNPRVHIEMLVQKGRSDILCLFIRHVSDLQSLDLLLIFKHFLSTSNDSYEGMAKVRKEWEGQALLAIEKATTQKGVPLKVSNLAREASILLMMAHDGFSASELCLHCVFSSPNLDELVLSSAISRLDGPEVLGLVRYLEKWLEKYQRFPEVVSCCPSAGSVLGLRVFEWIPSLESVVRGLGMVLDEHFSYLILNSNSHEEVKSLGNVVGSLVSEANLCCSLADGIAILQSELQC